MNGITEVTRTTFDAEVLKSPVPVLVDLYAPWCGPCRMMGPVLQEVAQQAGATAKVVKINTDDEPELAAAFGVEGVPTLALVKAGRIVDLAVGLTPAKTLMKMIEKAASAAA